MEGELASIAAVGGRGHTVYRSDEHAKATTHHSHAQLLICPSHVPFAIRQRVDPLIAVVSLWFTCS